MDTYEQKYKEALERATKYNFNGAKQVVKDLVTYIFPELAESEDEKVRKELIKETKGSKVRLFEIVTNDEFVAWLEKQGDKPAWSAEDVKKPNGGIVMEDFNDGNGFYKVNLAYLNEEQVKEIEEFVKRWDCQPKENEDESIISDLLDYFEEDKCLKHEVVDIIEWLRTIKPRWSDNEKKMLCNLIVYLDNRKDLISEVKDTYVSWLKSLKNRVLPQPKQEWSEEDEVRLQACLDTLQAKSLFGVVDTVLTEWLKQLKQRIGG